MNTEVSVNSTPTLAPAQARVVAIPAQVVANTRAEEPQKKASDIVLTPPKPAKLSVDVNELQKNLKEAIQMLNEQMKTSGRNLNFTIDQEVNRTIIRVRNTHTGELVRQIPDETVLRVAHNIEKVKGMLMDQIA